MTTQELQQTIINTFLKNLQFLQEYDFDLYNKVTLLSQAIETNEYKERYYIEYLEDILQFDIYDTNEEKYLYNKKINYFDKQAFSQINFDQINSFNLLQEHFYNATNPYIYNEDTPVYQKSNAKVINNILEYTKIFNTKTNSKEIQFKTIDKFVFIGTLLGTHITKLHKKIKAHTYFICENNLEIFRLSLFVTDYTALTKTAKIFFSIMDDPSIFNSKFNTYLQRDLNSNYMIKYFSTNYNISNYFEQIIITTGQHTPYKFSYRLMLDNLLQSTINNIKRYPLLHSSGYHHLLADMPVIIISAGPSLEYNIKWLLNNKDKFFIIAIGASLKKLLSNNIKPHLIISIDTGEQTAIHFCEDTIKSIQAIPLLLSTMSHDKVVSSFLQNTPIFFFEVMTTINKESKRIEGASIGEVTLNLALSLGANQIYLLGSDLALDQKTGNSHVDDYHFNKQYNIDPINNANNFMQKGSFSNKNTLINVKGNFQEYVTTTTTFVKSITAYNRITTNLNDTIKIYNLNNGAYIKNTIPTKVSDIKLDKLNTLPNIPEYLKEHSSTKELSNKALLEESIVFVNNILSKLTLIENKKVKTYNDFVAQRMDILEMLLYKSNKFSSFYLNNIFINFIQFEETYLYFYFSLQSTKNEANIIKKVKKIWIQHLRVICEDYKAIFNSILK